MKFRVRLFLAVLLPASLLVAACVAAALWAIRISSDAAVRDEFRRTQQAVAGIVADHRSQLGSLQKTFSGPWFEEFVAKGAAGNREALVEELHYELDSVNLNPDYFAAIDPAGTVWGRRYGDHECAPECRHPAETLPEGKGDAIFPAEDRCIVGRRLGFEDKGVRGALVVGRNIAGELRRLSENLMVAVVLLRGAVPAFSSLPDYRPAGPVPRTLRLGGERYIGAEVPLEGLGRLVLLRPMGAVDRQRRAALAAGGAGLALAVAVAAVVSARLSRRISRPVEALVDATRRVGAGDYAAAVDIPGRDELARLGAAFNDMTSNLRRRRDIMEKTLSRDVAEELMKGTALGGERREVTVLFMDVRGFTSATQGVDPEEVVATLNDMMASLAGAVGRHGGNVNKYLGDGLMAMFGAPRDLPDHALRAAQAAVEMQREMKAWSGRRAGRGLAVLRIGIGLNTGAVLGGNVGSAERLEYTLIGEEVNLASRVCGKAAPGQVLMTKATADRIGDRLPLRPLDPVQVKGLSYPVQVYEVIE